MKAADSRFWILDFGKADGVGRWGTDAKRVSLNGRGPEGPARPKSKIQNQKSVAGRGFTLLEVLIAVVVFVIAIAAILPLFAVGTTAHKRGMDQSHAAWIAPRIASRIQGELATSSPKDVRGGTWEEYGKDFTCDADFTRLSSRDGDPSDGAAWLLKVTVRWKEAGADRSETFETVALRRLVR